MPDPRFPPRSRASSGSPYEASIGFSRAVRVGNRILVSGTAPVEPDGRSTEGDAEAQAERCLRIIVEAIETLGGTAADVVRTRMFLANAADAPAVGRAHGRVFADIRPAATMLAGAVLLREEWLVEIEAEAIVAGNDDAE
jgi:enamine deaminase RidA (YjgF/YER057c/UK114 family)